MRQVTSTTSDPFAEVAGIQEEIRAAVTELAQTVTSIVSITDVPQATKDGHIEREVEAARSSIKELRLRERMLLDQVAAEVERDAEVEEHPIWAGHTTFGRSSGARMPERVQEAILVELVKSNTARALRGAPAGVLAHRLRSAIVARDIPSQEAIKSIVIERVLGAGHPDDEAQPPYSGAQHLLLSELGAVYRGYPDALAPILQMIADAQDARLSPEARAARNLVRRGGHRKNPLDLKLWASQDQLLKAVVERLQIA